MFCKLFETEKHGQILVKLDDGTDDSVAEVRFFVQPPGLGVCSFAAGFNTEECSDDEAWDKAEAMFEKIDEAEAIRAAESLLAMAGKFTPEPE